MIIFNIDGLSTGVKWCILVLDIVFTFPYIKTMTSELLTIKQVQEILSVSRAKVYKFFKDEKNPLPVIYISESSPRIKKEDLDKWIEEQNKIEGGEEKLS